MELKKKEVEHNLEGLIKSDMDVCKSFHADAIGTLDHSPVCTCNQLDSKEH